jgi:uncharacterized protein
MLISYRTKSIIFVGLLLCMAGCVSHILYQPQRIVRYTPHDAQLNYEDVSLHTQDGVKISGWWIPAEQARGTVLFCHGNGGNVSSCLDTLLIINHLRLNALIFDYRGYGNSEGSPTEEGTYEDAEAAWNYLVKERKVSPDSIVIWGRSLGGAIAAMTAVKHRAGIVIVESAFTSLKDLVHDRMRWVPSWVLTNYDYDTRHYIKEVNVPVLVIHSPDDEMIPFHHGKNLYDSIRGPKAFSEIKGSHNLGFIDSMAVYESSINGFINRYLEKQ